MRGYLSGNPVQRPTYRAATMAAAIAQPSDDSSLVVDRLARRMTTILDALDCGLMLCLGDEVVYQNRYALAAANSDCTELAIGRPPTAFMPDVVAAIQAELSNARHFGYRRIVSTGSTDPPLAVATVPLVRHSAVEQDLTLVVFGRRNPCELISACAENVLHELLECLSDAQGPCEPNRALVTLMFTDIVGSTQTAERLGDSGWQSLLVRHHGLIRSQLVLFHGREIDTAGDGFFATFDAPARAVRCASAIRAAAQGIGLNIRAGLHTGECELVGDQVIGVAVHVAARVASIASSGQILVTSTIKELVAGSGLRFSGGSPHVLKGLNGRWRLFELTGAIAAPTGLRPSVPS